jgi:hypothetical protein
MGCNRPRKITLNFDEFLDHFANDCMSFSDVAQIACEGGVSRERIRADCTESEIEAVSLGDGRIEVQGRDGLKIVF